MARIKGAMMTRKRRNKTLKLAKGYYGSKSKHFCVTNCVTPLKNLRSRQEKEYLR